MGRRKSQKGAVHVLGHRPVKRLIELDACLMAVDPAHRGAQAFHPDRTNYHPGCEPHGERAADNPAALRRYVANYHVVDKAAERPAARRHRQAQPPGTARFFNGFAHAALLSHAPRKKDDSSHRDFRRYETARAI